MGQNRTCEYDEDGKAAPDCQHQRRFRVQLGIMAGAWRVCGPCALRLHLRGLMQKLPVSIDVDADFVRRAVGTDLAYSFGGLAVEVKVPESSLRVEIEPMYSRRELMRLPHSFAAPILQRIDTDEAHVYQHSEYLVVTDWLCRLLAYSVDDAVYLTRDEVMVLLELAGAAGRK